MRVILGELTHPHYAVQRAVRFVAVAAAEFGEAQRQVAVALDPLAKHLDVRRAVHRLDRHQVARAGDHRLADLTAGHLVRHHEHAFAELAPMP